jgi:leucyl/phenylalanyl-tRNA--protein transferase
MDDREPPIIDPALVLLAYRSGIFPMADRRDDPDIFWVEPKRRGILPLDGLRCSHSLARTLRRGGFASPATRPLPSGGGLRGPRLRESDDGDSGKPGSATASPRLIKSFTRWAMPIRSNAG